ncbi:Efflux pump periplasmic linker BepF [Methylovirgula sp. HY1]|nr:Efflux pump periplasmic linker BepF [Methylovirgula sp. HY1]
MRSFFDRVRLPCGLTLLLGFSLLAGCSEKNRYVPPPPQKVGVALPLHQKVTPYLEATGNLAAVNTVKLVARVQGFVESIKYQDGASVKKGTPLFVIEPEPYKLKVVQAKAATDGAKAQLVQSQAEFERQSALQSRQVSTQALLDKARAQRDLDRATVESDEANAKQAEINYGYTQVLAPFDGVVTQRLVSVGELVGTNAATELASIIQLDPIWVNFNISERDAQTIRAAMALHGVTQAEIINKVPVEVGLQTDPNFPYRGVIDYIAPFVDASTGTLALRGILDNKGDALLPGYFVRVHVPLRPKEALLVPETSIGSDQSGRYVLVLGSDDVVAERKVTIGQTFGTMRVIEKGLTPEDRIVVAGIALVAPGEKVVPQMRKLAAADSDQK